MVSIQLELERESLGGVHTYAGTLSSGGEHTFLWASCSFCALCWGLGSSDPISTHLMILEKNKHADEISRLTPLRYDTGFAGSYVRRRSWVRGTWAGQNT